MDKKEEKSSLEARNIYTEFHRMLGREEKEEAMNQRGHVLWLYGLSGSGKSALANNVERALFKKGIKTQILDGDNIRSGLNKDLGFSDEDRLENIRRIAEVAKLFANSGILTLTAFITPKKELRELAKNIIGPSDFTEVYVQCSFETCEQRDVKGLYAKARTGGVAKFTGKDSAFETGEDTADVVIDTENQTLEESTNTLLLALEKRTGMKTCD